MSIKIQVVETKPEKLQELGKQLYLIGCINWHTESRDGENALIPLKHDMLTVWVNSLGEAERVFPILIDFLKSN